MTGSSNDLFGSLKTSTRSVITTGPLAAMLTTRKSMLSMPGAPGRMNAMGSVLQHCGAEDTMDFPTAIVSPEVAAVVAATWMAFLSAVAMWYGTQRPRRMRELIGGGALLLDVGTPAEYAASHAAGAINIPAAELMTRQNEIGAHERPIVLYGRSTLRSALAAQDLRGIGFHTVMTAGTLRRWRKQVEGG
jgi:rhodanese-related sulfurtransferase